MGNLVYTINAGKRLSRGPISDWEGGEDQHFISPRRKEKEKGVGGGGVCRAEGIGEERRNDPLMPSLEITLREGAKEERRKKEPV